MMPRALVVTVLFISVSLYLSQATRAEPTPIRQPLASLPLVVNDWQGRVEQPLSPRILEILRVDDYTTRTYFRSSAVVGLYVGYHATQRQGASIHSPLNCLPGAGWIPVEQGRLVLSVADGPGGSDRSIEVNRVVIEKGLDRQLVLYWYQSRGRVVASEYWGKAYSVYDAIRYNRTDAALIRVIAPVKFGERDATRLAENDARDFVQQLFPVLRDYLPS